MDDNHALPLEKFEIHPGGSKFAGSCLDFAAGFMTVRDLAPVISCDIVVVHEIVVVSKTSGARGAYSNLVVRLTRNAAEAFQSNDYHSRMIAESDGPS